jgi:hypothetical protein
MPRKFAWNWSYINYISYNCRSFKTTAYVMRCLSYLDAIIEILVEAIK